MAEPFETIHVDSHQVACDGGGGSLGHPRIYMSIKADEKHADCPYCSRRFQLKADAMASAGGH